MTLMERLLPLINQGSFSLKEISLRLGLSENGLCKKIENNSLTVKEAYKLSELLEINNPADVFFP